eukprot:574834-Amphidinium_carterae.3
MLPNGHHKLHDFVEIQQRAGVHSCNSPLNDTFCVSKTLHPIGHLLLCSKNRAYLRERSSSGPTLTIPTPGDEWEVDMFPTLWSMSHLLVQAGSGMYY